jgi:hypothetical protein
MFVRGLSSSGELSMSEHPTPAVTLVSTKNVGLAIALTFFFGPIGMLYSTIVGALTMFVLNVGALLLTAGLGLIVTWPIGIVWSALATMSHNKRVLSGIAGMQLATTPAVRSAISQAEASFGAVPSYRTEAPASASSLMPFDKRSAIVGSGITAVVLVVGILGYQRTVSSRSSVFSSSINDVRTNSAALAPAQSESSREAQDSSRSSDGTFRGAWFRVWAPPSFAVVPSLKSTTAQEGFDSVFFRSPDRQVEFYVFSPQWSGEPTDIALATTEKQTAFETKASVAKVVSWYSIEATDGSYIRTYQDTRSKDGSVRSVVGLKYSSKAAYDRYRADYARFKGSLTQFAD